MSRALVILRNKADREKVSTWADKAPDGTRVEFKAAKRTIPQNDCMWAMLTDIATQVPWHGAKLSPDDWKMIFMDALVREVRTAPNLDGTGLVNLGRSSDLSVGEMSDLMELISTSGAKHNVNFGAGE